MLPQLVKAAAGGQSTPLTRKSEGQELRALLVSPAAAEEAGVDLADAPAWPMAEARKKLGELVQAAAEGSPQVLRRHKTPVAVLIPDTAAAGTTPAAVPGPAAAAAGPQALAGTPNGGQMPPAPTTEPAAAPGTTAAGVPPVSAASPAAAPASGTTPPAAAAAAPTSVRAPGVESPLVPSPALPTAGVPAAPVAPVPPAQAPASGTAPAAPGAAEPATPAATVAGPAEPAAGAPPAPRRRLAPLAEVLAALPAPGPVSSATDDRDGTSALPGLPTGLTALDEALGGLQPGRFHLVAGAPGAGASLLALAAARTTALTHHRPVLYAASGLTSADIVARVIAAHTPVDYRRYRAGTLTPDERQAVADTSQLLTAAPLFIDDGTDLTTTAIASTVPDVPHLALLVVDRLQATHDPHLPLSGPTAIADAVQALTHLARTHHLPILAALDTDDTALLQSLAADLTLTLTSDGTRAQDGTRTELAITERDLGHLTTIPLTVDLTHARLTDYTPFDPYTGVRELTPAEIAAIKPFPSTNDHRLTPTSAPAAPQDPTAPATTPQAAQAAHSASHTPAEPTEPTAPAAPAQAPQTPPPATDHTPAAAAPAADSTQVVPAADPPTPPTATPPTAARTKPVAAHRSATYAGRDYSHFTQMITDAVEHTLEEHDGDTEAATEALIKRAIPDGMALFEKTRVGGNYEHTVYPETLEFLRKKTKDGVDEIWEGRHKWENTALTSRLLDGATISVTVLDTNAAYLSAFKTHLPIGALRHDPDGGFDPKRSGIYLLPARPTWEHPALPDPIGNRREEGPVLLDDATIRLLIRCHKLGLCEPPHITEAWTSGATEGLLEKFRRVLTEARNTAIQNDDDITLEYIKAMYSKFVSTIGESSVNRDIRRPDWMHIFRSQAFANLWFKAHRAHQNGLTIVRLRGTDELHITGETDWRTVFNEGRLTSELKIKDQYTLPTTRKTGR
ncbi:type II toxin-antitoxin system prevent-host-death family antitoxin [Streptomyces sp. NPDC020883]|uniref:type II toxin-antitoxin system prevent-host-death family antitoxin n=1 Tax=Streptomyces sp. NPDC020883 TaxID=3365099 RepID=UPI003788120F